MAQQTDLVRIHLSRRNNENSTLIRKFSILINIAQYRIYGLSIRSCMNYACQNRRALHRPLIVLWIAYDNFNICPLLFRKKEFRILRDRPFRYHLHVLFPDIFSGLHNSIDMRVSS